MTETASTEGSADSATRGPAATRLEQQCRLNDHFKTVYAIIAGVAITDAIGALTSSDGGALIEQRVMRFCTLLITLLPIFHGSDRSLEIRHGYPAENTNEKTNYVLDVYLLIITATLFVCLADTIKLSSMAFYFWLGGVMVFDALVLMFDLGKLHYFKIDRPPQPALWPAYIRWIGINIALAIICFVWAFWFPMGAWMDYWIFMCALLRTIADYWFGSELMFP